MISVSYQAFPPLFFSSEDPAPVSSLDRSMATMQQVQNTRTFRIVAALGLFMLVTAYLLGPYIKQEFQLQMRSKKISH